LTADSEPTAVVEDRVPAHVAIVMDGNGRWAQRRGLPRHAGHQAGVESVRTVIEECIRAGVRVLTLFAFSSENWRRPRSEVDLLFDLFLTLLRREARRLKANGVRLRVIGDRAGFGDKLRRRIDEAEQMTAEGGRLTLQIAANYGGRWDITAAARALCLQVRAGGLDPEEVDEQRLAAALSFPDLPDPDLFVRTGGEQRLSNFLLWQSAYSELYFTETLWPDFGSEAFREALRAFAGRERRFGRTAEQLRDRTAP
jgi:undecaprenyl diphosphate synthase